MADKKEYTVLAHKPLHLVKKEWEENPENEGKKLSEQEHVDLINSNIDQLDAPTIQSFKACKKLSLSSNCIKVMVDLNGLDNLQILSIGRNKIKVIKGLEFVKNSLTQLWISYNEIEKLDPIKNIYKLEKLYIGNNLIPKISELDNLVNLTNLKDVVFQGNPFALEEGSSISAPKEKKGKEREKYFKDIKSKVQTVEFIDGLFYISVVSGEEEKIEDGQS